MEMRPKPDLPVGPILPRTVVHSESSIKLARQHLTVTMTWMRVLVPCFMHVS
jgi:hypothetical protein